MGSATLKMKDIIALKTGDIIKLETGAKDDLLVTVENKPMFYAKIGTKGKKKAVKITSVIRKTDTSYEKKFSTKSK
jgi:flagellar motor switch protein FliM